MKSIEQVKKELVKDLKTNQETGDKLSKILKVMWKGNIPINSENIQTKIKGISKKNAEFIEAAIIGFKKFQNEFRSLLKQEYGVTLGSFAIVGSIARLSKGIEDIDVYCKTSGKPRKILDEVQLFNFEHNKQKHKMQIMLSNFSENFVLNQHFVVGALASSVLRFDDSFEDRIKLARKHIKPDYLFFVRKREIEGYLSRRLRLLEEKENSKLNSALKSIASTLSMLPNQDKSFGIKQVKHILNSFEKNSKIIYEELDSKHWKFCKGAILKTILSLIQTYTKEPENIQRLETIKNEIENWGKPIPFHKARTKTK